MFSHDMHDGMTYINDKPFVVLMPTNRNRVAIKRDLSRVDKMGQLLSDSANMGGGMGATE